MNGVGCWVFGHTVVGSSWLVRTDEGPCRLSLLDFWAVLSGHFSWTYACGLLVMDFMIELIANTYSVFSLVVLNPRCFLAFDLFSLSLLYSTFIPVFIAITFCA